MKGLVDVAPSLRPLLEEHLEANEGELLDHLFMWDVVRFVRDNYRAYGANHAELRAILRGLEASYRDGTDEVQELIAVSFLEDLDVEGDRLPGVSELLGPLMREQLQRIRDWEPPPGAD